jgi:hypothetical protein
MYGSGTKTHSGRKQVSAQNTTPQPPKANVKTYSLQQYQAYGNQRSETAISEQRKRIASVVGSSVSKGRERSALELLAYGNASSASIISQLAALPTDAELNAARAENKRKRNRAIWGQALGREANSNRKDSVMVAAMKGLSR